MTMILQQDFEDAYLIDDFEDITDWTLYYGILERVTDAVVDSYAMKFKRSYTSSSPIYCKKDVIFTTRERFVIFIKRTVAKTLRVALSFESGDVVHGLPDFDLTTDGWRRIVLNVPVSWVGRVTQNVRIQFYNPNNDGAVDDGIIVDQLFVCKAEVLGTASSYCPHLSSKKKTGNYGLGCGIKNIGGTAGWTIPSNIKTFYHEVDLLSEDASNHTSIQDSQDGIHYSFVGILNGNLYWYDGVYHYVGTAESNTWYRFKIYCDFVNFKYSLWIDEGFGFVLKAENINMPVGGPAIGLYHSQGTGGVSAIPIIDNLEVYEFLWTCSKYRIFTHGVYNGTTSLTPWRTSFKVASTEKKNYTSDFTTDYTDLTYEGIGGVANTTNNKQTIHFDFGSDDENGNGNGNGDDGGNYDTNEKFFTFWGEQLFTTRMARNPKSYLEKGVMVEEPSEQPPLYMVYATRAGTTYYDKEQKFGWKPIKTLIYDSFEQEQNGTEPSNWTINKSTGNTILVSNSNPLSNSKDIKFTKTTTGVLNMTRNFIPTSVELSLQAMFSSNDKEYLLGIGSNTGIFRFSADGKVYYYRQSVGWVYTGKTYIINKKYIIKIKNISGIACFWLDNELIAENIPVGFQNFLCFKISSDSLNCTMQLDEILLKDLSFEKLKLNLFSSFLMSGSGASDTQIRLRTEIMPGVCLEPIREIGIANDEILIGRITPIIPIDVRSGGRFSIKLSGGEV